MQRISARERAAATFFGFAAAIAAVLAIVTANIVLGAVAVVLAIAAVAALRSYPIDRVW